MRTSLIFAREDFDIYRGAERYSSCIWRNLRAARATSRPKGGKFLLRRRFRMLN
jgi:hypothetical protein